MNVIFAEAVDVNPLENTNGNNLCHARVLGVDSNKYKIMSQLFEGKIISYFLRIGDCINYFIKNDMPLVFVTDWTEPTEMLGLRLESEGVVKDYPNLHFLAFNTDWDNIKSSGIEEIFAHEFSHLWLNLFGYDTTLSKSNKFHTCTAITDTFMAFSEGFAEHFEIVTKDLGHSLEWKDSFWDYGYDVNAWLSLRDEQLRYHAIVNNRFIYHTAFPFFEDYETYNQLHLAHITSSSFAPEKLKNGNQMMASEGVIASIFYRMYQHELFKSSFLEDEFYFQFGVDKKDIDPNINLYLKIIFAISKIDLTRTTLMTDFIKSYGDAFSIEKRELYETFLKVTHFSTVSDQLTQDFGKLYRIGRSGDVKAFRAILKNTSESKINLIEKVSNGEVPLNYSLLNELWIEADEEITPTPWEPDEKAKYYFDLNTATEIDLLSLRDITLEDAKHLIRIRHSQSGFKTLEEFYNLLNTIRIKGI